MARKVAQHSPRRPKHRIDSARGYFYPGEVVRILDLHGLDYRQLRRIFRLVRESGEGTPPARRWARFSFRDLVKVQLVVELAGGREALGERAGNGSEGRLRLKRVEAACQRLRSEFGVRDPLTDVLLRRRGSTIVARMDQVSFEPNNGQLLLDQLEEAVRGYLISYGDDGRPEENRQLRIAFEEESRGIPWPSNLDVREGEHAEDNEGDVAWRSLPL